jgi:hypothetical protein
MASPPGLPAVDVDVLTDPDPYIFEHLLNKVKLVSLLDAARKMHTVKFFHGFKLQQETFDFELVRECLENCVVWAKSNGHDQAHELYDARRALQDAMGEELDDAGVQGMAAVRAWTCTPMCYVLNSVMRTPGRSRESMGPVLAYAKLLFQSLHALPVRFIFVGTVYRSETGVMDTWKDKKERLDKKEDVPHFFYVPTSFSIEKESAAIFKASAVDKGADRTMFTLNGAAGYSLHEFAPHQFKKEEEVLIEPVCSCTVMSMETPQHQYPGERLQGLHTMVLRVRPSRDSIFRC